MKRELWLLLEYITLGLFGLVVAVVLFHIVRFRVAGDFSYKMFFIFLVIGGIIIFLSLSGVGIL